MIGLTLEKGDSLMLAYHTTFIVTPGCVLQALGLPGAGSKGAMERADSGCIEGALLPPLIDPDVRAVQTTYESAPALRQWV